jgi:hypothetical protein
MGTGLSIQVLGKLRAGQFSPCAPQPCSHFQADRIAIGSRAWTLPALVLPDSTVSPRHALVLKEGAQWVVQDLDSDNGIRPVRWLPGAGLCLESGEPAVRFEFAEEFSCCVGAVVLRLTALK